MEITEKLLLELQNRLKVGNRRSVHLNAISGRSRYKFDISRLKHIDKNLPLNFIDALLKELPLKFKISWKENVPDLNTLLVEDQTQLVKITKSLENLINQTQTIESEKGINTFGFGFPILIRRDQKDNKLTVAPILIWSLKIKRTKEFNTWEILRNQDDPIYFNEVLVNHLFSDQKTKIDQVSSEQLEDGLIDLDELLEICINLINSINGETNENIREIFIKKLKNIKQIEEKKHYEKLPLTYNNSFIEFGGLFSIFEVQKQNVINDYENLLELKGAKIELEDLEKHSFQPISSVETDPSQQGILNSLKLTRNVLIQGPPGTGKSQSLTAILINALENHKKAIVVCEKQTALNVLYEALKKRGLEHHCIVIKDIVKDRRKVVNSVRERVDHSSYRKYRYEYSKESLDQIINKAKNLIDSINNNHKKLDEKLFKNNNWTYAVGSWLSELKNNSDETKLDISNFKFETSELNRILEVIRNAQILYDAYKPFKHFSFLNDKKLIGENLYKIEQEINNDFDYYVNEITLIKEQINEYEKQFYLMRNEELLKQEKNILKIGVSIMDIVKSNENQLEFYDEEKSKSMPFRLSAIFSSRKKAILKDQKILNDLFVELRHKTKASKDFEDFFCTETLKEKVNHYDTFQSSIINIKENFTNKIELEYKELNLLQSLASEYENELSEKIRNSLQKIIYRIQSDCWSTTELNVTTHYSFISIVEKIIDNKQRYFKNENDLFQIEFKWFQFLNKLLKADQEIIYQLLNKKNWSKTFLIHYLETLLSSKFNNDLPTNDIEHIELSNSLKELEKEQLKYIKQYWFSKQIDKTSDFDNSNPNLAVENLYNKRASKRHKRLSLREIAKFDKDLFTSFFPIILTTPEVSSNLFKGCNQYFDIVMFDEASQLRLEETLPALLKGKQIIIAGDEHQMPPSNYFSKIFDGSLEDEDEVEEEVEKIKLNLENQLIDCESLLDFGTQLGFEKKYLDFHYRSKHPYLIDFSNYAFYNQRLKPLPESFDYVPIKFIAVNGTYSDNSNDAEAETVLSILKNNIHRKPDEKYPTIGIATFNISQRNLIISKITNRRKFDEHKEFNDKIIELEENGLFIKNLENIQGDERDVIILSTTYGTNKESKFYHRLGAINHQKGYKLLNVIITRAKYKIYVCSSVPIEHFLDFRKYLISEGANNRRGIFFAYLAYAKAVSEQDEQARMMILNSLEENSSKKTSINFFNEDLESPFEEEVYAALLDHFDSNKITPQLKFGGFRIDIVYNPKIQGKPKIAIECDGAKYHSSKEAYLYDLHRQKILEENGFVFHRIWSINWFRNPKRETQRLVEFIKNIEETKTSNENYNSQLTLSFNDNIIAVENELNKENAKPENVNTLFSSWESKNIN